MIKFEYNSTNTGSQGTPGIVGSQGTHKTLDWTHKHIKITDIRKLNKFYVITINDATAIEQITKPLFVKNHIFEERLRSYFLKDTYKITREEILDVEWNMYISRGHYVKIDKNGVITKFDHDPNKWYISYLEINGELGSFASIYRDEEELK